MHPTEQTDALLALTMPDRMVAELATFGAMLPEYSIADLIRMAEGYERIHDEAAAALAGADPDVTPAETIERALVLEYRSRLMHRAFANEITRRRLAGLMPWSGRLS